MSARAHGGGQRGPLGSTRVCRHLQAAARRVATETVIQDHGRRGGGRTWSSSGRILLKVCRSLAHVVKFVPDGHRGGGLHMWLACTDAGSSPLSGGTHSRTDDCRNRGKRSRAKTPLLSLSLRRTRPAGYPLQREATTALCGRRRSRVYPKEGGSAIGPTTRGPLECLFQLGLLPCKWWRM